MAGNIRMGQGWIVSSNGTISTKQINEKKLHIHPTNNEIHNRHQITAGIYLPYSVIIWTNIKRQNMCVESINYHFKDWRRNHEKYLFRDQPLLNRMHWNFKNSSLPCVLQTKQWCDIVDIHSVIIFTIFSKMHEIFWKFRSMGLKRSKFQPIISNTI